MGTCLLPIPGKNSPHHLLIERLAFVGAAQQQIYCSLHFGWYNLRQTCNSSFSSAGTDTMSRYDELVSIYLKAKDEYENDGRICRDFAHDLMKSIFRAFDCPAGIMAGDSRRNNEGFWENAFWLMIVPNFSSSLAVKKSDGHFMVKFESDDTQFIIRDMKSDNLESFYHFVFERWKEKLTQYFQARPEVDAKRESGQYL